MADLIKIKGGNGNTPKLQDREPAYNKDEKALYIGTEDGNVKVGDAGWEQRINDLKVYVDGLVAGINARLDALEKSE